LRDVTRIALFATCLADTLFPDVPRATVTLPDAEVCCGFGGTFAVKNADTSTAMLTDKMRNVLATGAEVCTAGDSSCLMHIGGGLSRLRTGVKTVHLAEILAATAGAPAARAAAAVRC
jgi:L-lactate dehydrogenase complex protein LldE